MAYAERMLDYLWSIAPDGATNSQIADRLSIRSHQTVYMLTQDLLHQGLIRSERRGRGVCPTKVELGCLPVALSLGNEHTARNNRGTTTLGMGLPEGAPASRAPEGSEGGDRLGVVAGPAHPRSLLAFLDQRFAGAFDCS